MPFLQPHRDLLVLQTPFYQRTIHLDNGVFSWETMIRPPESPEFIPCHHNNGWGLPFESAVKYDGRWHSAGIRRQQHVLWQDRQSEFELENIEVAGTLCHLHMAGRELRMKITLELSEELPYFAKHLTVTNCSGRDITVENLCPELFYSVRCGRNLEFLSDFRLPVQGVNRHEVGYVDFQFPSDVDHLLKPGESMESFRLVTMILPENEERKSIWRSRILRSLCPHAAHAPLTFQCTGTVPRGNGINDFSPVIEACAEAGIEQIMFFLGEIFTNTGDYELRPDFFPRGETDLRELLRRIRAKGMESGVYCSYSIAAHGSRVRESHRDWECQDSAGHSYDPGALGNMCFLSPWGDDIREKMFFLASCGFREFQIDGPTSIPCFNPLHHHRSQGDYQYSNWLWEKKLFQDLAERKVRFTIPRNGSYLLMGSCAQPGGYTEEDFCHTSGTRLLTAYRSSVFHARKTIPAWGSWGFLALGDYHGHNIGADEAHPEIYEHALVSLLGYGHARSISGSVPFFGPKTKALLQFYLNLFRKNRNIMESDCIPVEAPTGTRPDAICFADPSIGKALGFFLNPASLPRSTWFKMEFGAGKSVSCRELKSGDRFVLSPDDAGRIVFSLKLEPLEVKIIEFDYE